ncbi:DnaA N-terminal domain-containing protein [Sphingosinicella sp. BN140058]|uniref:DnaA N-terminal domain-containing protein n=1 Tax=Sphingosinicella sp. BN140058 TaxID=1892855 RepID=UPI0013EB9FFD|nr:helix-turn-helix domain-containing protein [Sphingosinicella sp. BN140058]
MTELSTAGRASLDTVPNYRLCKAATRAEASPQARLLLVHLIGYLGVDQRQDPSARFVVFPGNTRLADELNYSTRSIQRLADELESKGLLRRCYNGLNRRTGFDLTPLAMQHETIEANICAVHTRRRQERDRLQLELTLEADRIRRPVTASPTTSQDDEAVTLNRPNHQDSAESGLSAILDSVDESLIEKLGPSGDPLAPEAEREAQILQLLTGSGRAAHLGWFLAKKTYGLDRAIALCAIAENDPKRKATTERYFGWLVRMAMTGDGHTIIEQAAYRARTKAGTAGAKVCAPAPVPTAELRPIVGEDATMTAVRQAIKEDVGAGPYHSWFDHLTFDVTEDVVTVRARNAFNAAYVESNFGGAIEAALTLLPAADQRSVRYEVA